jgi:hypothetical protein
MASPAPAAGVPADGLRLSIDLVGSSARYMALLAAVDTFPRCA